MQAGGWVPTQCVTPRVPAQCSTGHRELLEDYLWTETRGTLSATRVPIAPGAWEGRKTQEWQNEAKVADGISETENSEVRDKALESQ